MAHAGSGLVESMGNAALQAACVLPVSEGMQVKTNTPRVQKARKLSLELLLSNHDRGMPDLCSQPHM